MWSLSVVVMSMEYLLLFVQRRKVSLLKMYVIAIIKLSKIPLKSSEYHSIYIVAQQVKRTTSLLQTSSVSYMMMVNSSSKRVSNITTKRLISSWQTAISWENALIVAIPMRMATNARSVVATLVLWNWRILTLLSLAHNLLSRRQRTGTCLWTITKNGWSSGFSRIIKSGVQTFTDSVRAGWIWTCNLVQWPVTSTGESLFL